MLLKPSGGVPHVGGVLSRPGEPAYDLLRQWIAAGVQLDNDAPRVASIELLPKDPQLPLPGMKQQMVVLATYADGRVRDVTAEAFVDSSLAEIAEINKHGLVTAVRRGEAAALARFEGNYAARTITVMGDRSGFAWEDQPEFNFIDALVDEKLQRMKILPSGVCTDADFIRRVYLDLTGLPPSPEAVRAFLGRLARNARQTRRVGRSPDWLRRVCRELDQQVGRPVAGQPPLLEREGCLGPAELDSRGDRAQRPLRSVRPQRADRQRFDVRESARLVHANAPRAGRRDGELDAVVPGVRFNCNKCHDHPFERWTQNQYYHLAAYFAQVGRKPGNQAEEEIIYDTHGTGEVAHVKTGLPMAPAFPYQHSQSGRTRCLAPRAIRQLGHVEREPVLRHELCQSHLELPAGRRA